MCTSWQTTYPHLLVTKRCLFLLIFFPIVHLIAWRKPVRTWSVYYFLILKEHIHFTWNGKFKLPINLIKTIYFILLWLLGCRKVHPRHFIHSSYLIKQCRYISVCKNSWDLWRALLLLASRWRSMVFDGGPLNWTFYPYPPCMTKWPWGTSTYFLSTENLEEEVFKNCVMIWFWMPSKVPCVEHLVSSVCFCEWMG